MDDAGFAGKFVGFAGLCGFAGYVACLCLCRFYLFSFFGAKKNLTCKIILPEKAVPTFSCDEEVRLW